MAPQNLHNPLDYFPAEISFCIFACLPLEPKLLFSLLNVNRQFCRFLKSHESELVRTACNSKDPLSYVLVIQHDPSYRAYFALRREKAIYHSIEARLIRDGKYQMVFDHRKDPTFYKSRAAQRLLRAGFLVQHRIISTPGRVAKQELMRAVPLELWALMWLYHGLIRTAMSWYSGQRIAWDGTDGDTKVFQVATIVIEIAYFSSLQAIRGFFDLADNFQELKTQSQLNSWAEAYKSKHVRGGAVGLDVQSILDTVSGSKEKALLGEYSVSAIIRHGRRWFELSGDFVPREMSTVEHPWDDFMERTGILAAAQKDEKTFVSKIAKPF